MARLPSGRHFALDSSPLQSLVDGAQSGLGVHRLMNLDNTKKLYEHINILYFRQSNQRSNLELSKFSVVPPDGYEAYASGFNLMTIEDELGSWSAEDQAAFVRFLDTKRVSKFLESLIEEIVLSLGGLVLSVTTLLPAWRRLRRHGRRPQRYSAARSRR